MNQQDGGFVYVQTNDADDNEVPVFQRGGDGKLERLDDPLGSANGLPLTAAGLAAS